MAANTAVRVPRLVAVVQAAVVEPAVVEAAVVGSATGAAEVEAEVVAEFIATDSRNRKLVNMVAPEHDINITDQSVS